MKISVLLNSFPQELERAVETAAGLGVDAVQIPLTLQDDKNFRKSLLKAVQRNGLAVSATAVSLGDWGDRDSLRDRLETARSLIEMTREMETAICQTHLGIMPYSGCGPRWDSFVETAELLSGHAESLGVCIALETGPEPPVVMEKLLKTIDSPALGVNYDPANLILWPAAFPHHPDWQKLTEMPALPYDRTSADTEFEPIEGVKRLGSYIVHTHAKDAVPDGGWHDVPLGAGEIDWSLYLQYLMEVGFDGYLCIEREAGNDRVRDIEAAVHFLRSQLERLEMAPAVR